LADKDIDMKIVVIGRTNRIRSETIERLRQEGHAAAAANPERRFKFRTEASRDPGHAGRHLRAFLTGVAAGLRSQWLALGRRTEQLRRLLAGREASALSSDPGRRGSSEG
jgi:hypothetical protein